MKPPNTVVTIDGLAGAGKSTVARKLANKLRFVHLNSGALYRSVALELINRGINALSDELLVELSSGMKFDFSLKSDGETLFLVNGQDWRAMLVREDVSSLSSKIAVYPKFRKVLDGVQREAAKKFPLVLEGRDAGTVVFPRADFKFYLDASLDARAGRRFHELREKAALDDMTQRGREAALERIRREIAERDKRDRTREAAPTLPAEDALIIDSTGFTVEQVVEKLYGIVMSSRNSNA